MPYCVQCGKMIAQEVLVRNNGECDECYQKAKKVDPQLLQSKTQSSVTNLESCAYCATLTSVHYENCNKPLCQKHIVVSSSKYADEFILCEKYNSEKENRRIIWGCSIGFIFIILFFIGMLSDLR